MAITKVYAVRNHLHRIVSYAANEQKTELDGIIEYAVNPNKTEKRLFETTINCRSVATAYEDMKSTKARWNKTDKVLAYHFIQSFKPGEVTPDLAHEIGVTFAKECFGDRFEIVVGTHLDKKHLHNHVVINSVSFVDGSKYHSSPQSYYKIIRAISDRLCKEHNLSIIKPNGKGKHYAEWKAEQNGKPTIRSIIRHEVDEIIKDSYTFKTFIELLRRRGYSVKYGERVKYIAVKPPYSIKYIRLKSLGENYTEENIKLLLEAQRKGIKQLDTVERKPPKRYKLIKGTFNILKPKKIKGFTALYLHYLYLLGKVKKRTAPKKVSFLLREDILKFERYQKQFRFLHANNINTKSELITTKNKIEGEMSNLVSLRENLYLHKKEADTEDLKSDIQSQIASINTQLREFRKDKKLCENIENDINIIAQNLHQIDEVTKRPNYVKEEHIHEHKRRSSRFDC
jgi:hypothetical protein